MSSSATHQLTVLLFTDLVGSSALKTTLGDLDYAEKIARPHNSLFREILASIPGAAENNYTGDGFLATFPSVADAVHAALRFQQALATHPWEVGAPRTRIGVHVGEVVLIEGRADQPLLIASHAADMCARLMSLGDGGQILLTRHAFDDGRQYVRAHPPVPGGGEPPALRWMAHGLYRFKGKDDDPLEVFEVGAVGLAPLAAPKGSEKAHRVVSPDEEDLLGWRPAITQEVPGRRGWLLRRKLGAGGFGEVWLAEHARTREPRVFKFCFDPDRLRSFRRELTLFRLLREALGDREDIARLHEVQLDRAPYFLESEFTPEGDLRVWTDGRGGVRTLPLETRLDLVARTAEAVAAAHSVGVLHKDLKPANVLVHVAEDGSPRPRICDFGIGVLEDSSRLREHGITAAGFTLTSLTQDESSRTGTRMYSPPESLVGRPFTTAGDVYALGVLLYQMAVGDLDRPLAPGWERDVALPDAGAGEILRADIALMVDGDPARRLASAAEAAERIRSIGARRDAAAKRRAEEEQRAATERRIAEAEARRRRTRRLAAGTVGALLVLLALGTIFLLRERVLRQDAEDARRKEAEARNTAQAREADANAARAETEKRSRELEAVASFQAEMLSRADLAGMASRLHEDLLAESVEALRREKVDEAALKVRTTALADSLRGVNFTNVALRFLERNILARALEAIDRQFGNQPTVQASLLQTVASMRISLGLVEEATSPQERALEIRRRVLGEDHRDTLRSCNWQAKQLTLQGRAADAEARLREALDRARRALGPEDRTTLSILQSLAAALHAQGRLVDAEPYQREVYETSRKALGEDDADTMQSTYELGCLLLHMGKAPDAEPYARNALACFERNEGTDARSTLLSLMSLGQVLQALGKWGEAEDTMRAALAGLRKTHGDYHQDTLAAIHNIGVLCLMQRRLGDAEECLRTSMDGYGRTLGPENPRTIGSARNLAGVLREQRKLAEAEALLRETLQRCRSAFGNDHEDTARTCGSLGEVLEWQGRWEDAVAFLREGSDGFGRLFGPDHPEALTLRLHVATSLQAAGKFAEAESILRDLEATYRRLNGPEHATTMSAAGYLGMVFAQAGKPKEAEPVLRAVWEWHVRTNGRDDGRTLRILLWLGEALFAQGRFADAADSWREARDGYARTQGPEGRDTIQTTQRVGSALERDSRLAEAEREYRAALGGFVALSGPDHQATAGTRLCLGRTLRGLGRFRDAEAELLGAERVFAGASPVAHRKTVEEIEKLYTGWDAAEPQAGHGTKAAEWRRKLQEKKDD